MPDISVALEEAAAALMDYNAGKALEKGQLFSKTLGEIFFDVSRSSYKNDAKATLHLISECAKIDAPRALSDLISFSIHATGKSAQAITDLFDKIATSEAVEAYINSQLRLTEHQKNSTLGKKFLRDHLKFEKPTRIADDAEKTIQLINRTYNQHDLGFDAQQKKCTGILLEIVKDDAVAFKHRKAALYMLRAFYFEKHITAIDKNFAVNVQDVAIKVYGDPSFSLKKTIEKFEKFIENMREGSPFTDLAVAVYPHVRDAVAAKPPSDKKLHEGYDYIHFLEDLLGSYHENTALHRAVFKDYEAAALPRIHERYYAHSFSSYETHKMEYAHKLIFGQCQELGSRQCAEDFPGRAEGEKAAIESLQFSYANRERALADDIATESISMFLRHVHRIPLDSIKMNAAQVWANLRLGDTRPEDVLALITHKDEYFDAVIPPSQFHNTRDYVGRALYEELMKRAGDNSILQLRLGIAFTHFMSNAQLKSFGDAFKAEAGKDAQTVWPLLEPLSREYRTYITGTSIHTKRHETISDMVNDYLGAHIDGLIAKNTKGVITYLKWLLEDRSGDSQEYVSAVPLNRDLRHHLWALEEKYKRVSADKAMKLTISA